MIPDFTVMVLKTENPGNSIYFTEVEKYGKTTVTFEKPQVENKTTTGHDQFQPTKLLRKINPENRTKIKNSRYQKAQPCRLSH